MDIHKLYYLLAFLSINISCSPQNYIPTPAKNSKECITFEYKKLSKKECKKRLGNKKYIKKGFQPVQVTITNTTSHTFNFATQHLNMPTISTKTVLKTMSVYLKDHALKLTIIGAFLCWPALIAGVVKLIRLDSSTELIEYNLDNLTLQNQEIPAHSMISGIIFINPKTSIKNHTCIQSN